MDNERNVKKDGPGMLYLCATPIGNLEDITYRVLRVLSLIQDLRMADTFLQRIKMLSLSVVVIQVMTVSEHHPEQPGQADPGHPDLLSQGEDGPDTGACKEPGGLVQDYPVPPDRGEQAGCQQIHQVQGAKGSAPGVCLCD